MILVDEDRRSVIDDEALLAECYSVTAAGYHNAATWIGPYKPDSKINASLAAWSASHYEIYLRAIQEMPAPGHVLDVGCGSGARSTLLARYGNTVVAVDRDKDRIAFAEKHNAHPAITYRCETFPCELTGPFDYVMLVSVLYQQPTGPEWNAVLGGAKAALKPGGMLFVYDNNSELSKLKDMRLVEPMYAGGIVLWAKPQEAGSGPSTDPAERQISASTEAI